MEKLSGDLAHVRRVRFPRWRQAGTELLFKNPSPAQKMHVCLPDKQ
jgi:hypothetical protein